MRLPPADSVRYLRTIDAAKPPLAPVAACVTILGLGLVVLPETLVHGWSVLSSGLVAAALLIRLRQEPWSARVFWALVLTSFGCATAVDWITQVGAGTAQPTPSQAVALTGVHLAGLLAASFAAILALGPSIRFAILLRWVSAAELALASIYILVWTGLARHGSWGAASWAIGLTSISFALMLIAIFQLIRSPSRPEGIGCLTWIALLFVVTHLTGFLVDVGFSPRVQGAARVVALLMGLRAAWHPQFALVARLATLDRGDDPVSAWRRIMATTSVLNLVVAWLLLYGYQSRIALTAAVVALVTGTAMATRRSALLAMPPEECPHEGVGGDANSRTPMDVLVEELAGAMLDGQLTLHYQPVVDVHSERIVGAEALLRWNHPRNVAMPPDLILHIARSGMISRQLEDWILGQAIADAPALADAVATAGELSYLGINITPQQLEDPGLTGRVIAMLDHHGVEPGLLTLELTEHEAIQSMHAARASMADLQRHGISVALDDFGAGVANIHTVTHLSFDIIKLDRTFVVGLSRSAKTPLVAESLRAVRHLDARLIIEGVENRNDQAVSEFVGQADYVQGFAYGHPMHLADFRRHAASRGRDLRAAPFAGNVP